MRRFSFSADERDGDRVELNRSESHHICKVLRLKQGTPIELFDGFGSLYNAVITDLGKRVEVRLISLKHTENQASAELHVGLGIIKPKNMELLLQKCTELGVSHFIPFISDRTQGNLIRQVAAKDERWSRIIEEACKQCQRTRPMTLAAVHPFENIISAEQVVETEMKLIFWEEEKGASLNDLQKSIAGSSKIKLFFGPEGGFTKSEVIKARQAGWHPVGLGKRVLRTETAVIAAVSIVQYLLGDIS